MESLRSVFLSFSLIFLFAERKNSIKALHCACKYRSGIGDAWTKIIQEKLVSFLVIWTASHISIRRTMHDTSYRTQKIKQSNYGICDNSHHRQVPHHLRQDDVPVIIIAGIIDGIMYQKNVSWPLSHGLSSRQADSSNTYLYDSILFRLQFIRIRLH